MRKMKDKELIAELRARNVELESENVKLQLKIKDLEFTLARIPTPKAHPAMFKDANTDEHPNKVH